MTAKDATDTFINHFKKPGTAALYDKQIGGVTTAIAKDIISSYLKSNFLEGKTILDNACGTGAVTKEILSRASNVKIEAADIAEPMVNYLRDTIATPNDAKKVTTAVMDGQVDLLLLLTVGIDIC